MVSILTNLEKFQIFEKYKIGVSIEKLYEQYGTSKRNIKQLIQRRLDNKVYKLTDFQKLEIIKKYKTKKYSLAKLGKEYNVTRCAIRSIIKKQKIEILPNIGNKKYSLNEHYFDKIDTEDKAYFLGLLYADGCNYENIYQVCISLKYSDKKIIEKFNKCIGSNRKLDLILRNEENKNYENQSKLTIVNKNFSKSLAKLGCFKKKSHTLKFPTTKQVPKHLMRHFLRGYFDGDGCIYISPKNYIVCSFYSSKFFSTSCSEFIYKQLGFQPSIYKKRDKKKFKKGRIFSISSKKNCFNFLNWIYNDSKFFLDRKKKKYLRYYK